MVDSEMDLHQSPEVAFVLHEASQLESQAAGGFTQGTPRPEAYHLGMVLTSYLWYWDGLL